MTETTLCYIEHEGKYLMLLRNKKSVDLNKGKWIGVGGKLEKGETPDQCAIREIREETGLTARRLVPRGTILFCSEAWGREIMYLYTVTDFEGILTECDEGELRWIDKRDVFDLHLWDGDRIFLRLLLSDAPYFEMTLSYDKADRLRQCLLNGQETELFDIYRENGTPAGFIASRDDAHARGLWHVTAHIWIARTGSGGKPELLLQLRSAGKRLYPGCYDTSSAGHIAAGEDIRTGARREIEEELGLHIRNDQLQYVGTVRHTYDDEMGEGYHDREHCHVFLCRCGVRDSDLHLQPSEVDGVMWMDYDALVHAVRYDEIRHCIDLPELEMIRPLL